MKLIFKLILKTSGPWKFINYIFLGICSGLCSFLFIKAVTFVIGLIISKKLPNINLELLLVFLMIILLFIWIRRTLSQAIINLSQVIFWQLRKQLISLVLKSDYHQLIIFKDRVNAVIVNDVIALTQASMSIIEFFTAFVLSISCLVYLAYISIELFFITLVVALTGIFVYQVRSKENIDSFKKARDYEDQFLRAFSSILGGSKEINMERLKGAYIYKSKILSISKASFDNNTTAFSAYLTNQITGQVLFYLLITSVLLIFSIKLNISYSDTVSFVFTLLYLLGSIETIMVLFPGLMRAIVSANVIMTLKSELESSKDSSVGMSVGNLHEEFEVIELKEIEYNYGPEANYFKIGPINLKITAGSIVFIYGGNGSGKTTFMNVLLGMIPPAKGKIYYNSEQFGPNDHAAYRSKFAVVFSDFYLFDHLYNADCINIKKLEYYLQLFDLGGKVTFSGREFSTIDVSTGQRKRLALIMALMEGKKILVLDEWAADQDPSFRKKFYTEILQILRMEGITVIAVTHDDKYFDCADVLLKMEDGKIIL